MKKVILLIAVLVMSVGCALNKGVYENQIDKLKNTATFDLDCPKDKLKINVIDSYETWGTKIVESAGVSGCGKRMRYIQVNGQWVANTKSK